MLKTVLFAFLTTGLLLGAFYVGMSRDLCRRHLSDSDYQKMALDCSAFLYR